MAQPIRNLITPTIPVAACLMVSVALYQAMQAVSVKEQQEGLSVTIKTLEQQIATTRSENEGLAKRLSEAQAELPRNETFARTDRPKTAALPAQESPSANVAPDPFGKRIRELKGRSEQLYRLFESRPGSMIPEMQLLKESLWITLAEQIEALKLDLRNEEHVHEIMAMIRGGAKQGFHLAVHLASDAFAQSNPGQTLASLQQLKPYFKEPIDDALLMRYQLAAARDVSSELLNRVPGFVRDPSEMLLIEMTPPADPKHDSRYFFKLKGGHRTSRWEGNP
ncbi:MAG: hypothetical protein WCO60_05955 [Verrucomicrobiota bacterium]